MVNNYYLKQRNHLYQKAKIIIANPKFQEEVKLLREKWNIPKNGFLSETENENWHHWLSAISDEFLEKNDSNGREKDINDFNKKIPLNDFYQDVKILIIKYHLPQNWHESIKRYLMFNNIDLMGIPGNVSIVTEFGKYGSLMLEINADTTLEDIKSIWSWVKSEQKRLPDKSIKFQPAPMFDIDKEAFELREIGNKMSEIADLISTKFDLESYTYKSVSESIKRHKKRIGVL